jgi:hypothetical protein
MQSKRYKNKKHCSQSWTLYFKMMVKRDDFKQPVDTSNDLFWHRRILELEAKVYQNCQNLCERQFFWVAFGKENPAPDKSLIPWSI